MGADISVQEMENFSTSRLNKLNKMIVKTLQQDVKEVYDTRMRLQGITVE